jgi:CBS domain-containing protein
MTVREIMQPDVITVTPDTTARELARLLQDAGVSGVPVCDATGRVVGVVSATDLVRLAAEQGDDVSSYDLDDDVTIDEDENESGSWAYFLDEEPPARFVDLDGPHGPDLDTWTVRDIMTPAPHVVEPSTDLPELARLLLREKIHRALVVEEDRLVGIVTTLDVLRQVAEAA